MGPKSSFCFFFSLFFDSGAGTMTQNKRPQLRGAAMQIDDPDGLVTSSGGDMRNESLLSDEYFSGSDSGEFERISVEHTHWKLTWTLCLLG
jgi:hypothetical protein